MCNILYVCNNIYIYIYVYIYIYILICIICVLYIYIYIRIICVYYMCVLSVCIICVNIYHIYIYVLYVCICVISLSVYIYIYIYIYYCVIAPVRSHVYRAPTCYTCLIVLYNAYLLYLIVPTCIYICAARIHTCCQERAAWQYHSEEGMIRLETLIKLKFINSSCSSLLSD